MCRPHRLRALGLMAVLFLAGTAASAQVMPGPYDQNFTWVNNNRILSYCIDAATPAVIANGVQDAAWLLSAMGSPWTLNNAGACPMNWSMRAVPFVQPNIRVRIAPLGALNLPANGFPNQPQEPGSSPTGSGSYGGGSSDKPNPNDQPPVGGNRVFVSPPLAYFQPGPFVWGGRQIAYGEVVFNYQVVNGVMDPRWDTAPGTRAFDPIEVGMHELGHAVRLDHDDTVFNDDVVVIPSGAASPLLIPNDVAIQKGPDLILQTPAIPDDVIAGGDIVVGNDLWAESGKKMCVMRSGIQRGEHGINPLNGFPANSDYAYTDREQASARAAGMHIPPGQNASVHIYAGKGRAMDWNLGIGFYNAAGLLVAGWVPPVVQDDLTKDFIVFGAPAAPKFYAEGDVYLTAAPANKTHVQLWGNIGAAPANAAGNLRIWVPYTAAPVKLGIVADWFANTVTYFDMTVNPALQLFQMSLTAGHPVDNNWQSIGVVNIMLVNAPAPPPPPPPQKM